ncbi:MAG: hypothetical protein HZT41_07790 [Dechloromonas sp.]|nr:MAG: hypothetical protein HZT41_07790 [Dechloromonas sp.]
MLIMITMKGGRTFELEAVLPYVRKDASASALAVWRGTCRQCGAPFEVATSTRLDVIVKSKALARVHCDEHKLRRRPKATPQPSEGVAAATDHLTQIIITVVPDPDHHR